MNIQELFTLPSWSDRLTQLKASDSQTARPKDDYIAYYGGKHPILKDAERQDVQVTIYKVGEDGKKVENGAKTVTKTKKILNYPVQLIGTLASFVFGNPPELILNNEPKTEAQEVAFKKFKEVWAKESRLDEHNKKLLRTVSIETEGAELFFNDTPDKPKEGKIKVMLLSKENGDLFWPFFNDNRDLEAFTRRYTKKEVKEGAVVSKTYDEIWTADRYILIDTSKGASAETPVKDTNNVYGKIPVVYYDQKLPEWDKIAGLIDTIEKKESQLSDVNTRVGHAAVKITGELVNMPDATADVKVYQVKPVTIDGKTVSGDVSYLESQTAPESVKLELERTEEAIYKFTNIPNLYEIFKNATNESGKALKIRLFPINIIIDEKKEIYAPGLDRRISVLKTMLNKITGEAVYNELDIVVNFRDYIPEDVADTIDKLMTANGNKPILSQEKSVELSGLVKNAAEEYKKIKDEASANMGALAGSFGSGLAFDRTGGSGGNNNNDQNNNSGQNNNNNNSGKGGFGGGNKNNGTQK